MKSRRQSTHLRPSAAPTSSSLRFLTRLAALAATGATVVIGVVVAKEHPGGSTSKCCFTSVPDHVGNDHLGPGTSTTTTSPPTLDAHLIGPRLQASSR